MDKRTEEKLSQLAFGELDEREAAEVRELAAKQPEGAAVLDAYEAMRADLKRLRDVPPDQLSKERLQNAILGGGLKPKPVRTGIPWLWVPSTALTLVLGFFLISRLPSGPEAAPQGGSDNRSALMLNPDDLNFEKELRQSTYGAGATLDEAHNLGPAISAPAVADAAVSAVSRKVSAAKVEAGVRRYEGSTRIRTIQMPRTAEAQLVPMPATLDESTGNYGPLVIIQSGRDRSTGAQNAVEVSHTEDVIVSS